MADDLAFELQAEKATREIAVCNDVEGMRHLTTKMIDMMTQQRQVTRSLLTESLGSDIPPYQ